jgi:UDP-glucose 4-epimerase
VSRHPLDRADCLVLGGGGFIGTHLCRALAAAGARVTGFGRQPCYPDALRGIPFLVAEFADREALAQAVAGRDYVFHLLGGTTPDSSNRDPAADLAENTLATLRLLEACVAGGGPKVVFASSGGTVYGIPGRIPIREDAPTDPISAYGVSKLAVEKYLRVYHHLHALPYVVLRLANPFGPWQRPGRGQGVVATLLQRALRGEPLEIWGDGRVVRDFLYAEDAVAALVAAAPYPGPHRVLNVGSGVGRSVGEVAGDIARLLGRRAAQVAAVHGPARPADVPVNVLDIGLIERELGWRPRVAWADALRRTAEWIAGSSAPG